MLAGVSTNLCIDTIDVNYPSQDVGEDISDPLAVATTDLDLNQDEQKSPSKIEISSEDELTCNFCRMNFDSIEKKREHVSGFSQSSCFHSYVKNLECPSCREVFHSDYHLTVHSVVKHTKQKPQKPHIVHSGIKHIKQKPYVDSKFECLQCSFGIKIMD